MAPQVRCPTLTIRGYEEPPDLYPAEEYALRSSARVDVEIIPDCGHYYTGKEQLASQIIAGWLDTRLRAK